MTVKEFVSMIKGAEIDNEPLKIDLCADTGREYEIVSRYDPDNPYHRAAFGNWKIKNITAVFPNAFELLIDTVTQIITE